MKKVIFITGTSRGLGKMTLERLKAQGHIVYGSSRHPKGVNPYHLKLDVTDSAQCQAAVDAIVNREGKLDVLINNAGGHMIGAAAELSNLELHQQMELNFYGAVNCTKACLPYFLKQGYGQIISISSIMGSIALPYSSAYCAAKFALEGYMESLRLELLPFNISVSITKTAYINTGVVISNPEIELEEYKELRSKIKNIMDERSPKGIPPEKVAVKIMEIISASRPKFRYKVDQMTKILTLFKSLGREQYFEKRLLNSFNLPSQANF